MKKQINLGLIGIGYWGLNYVRIFNETPKAKLKFACDLNSSRLKLVKKSYPDIILTSDYREIISNSEVDAVVVATPATSHHQIVKESLENNKHVLVEKPLTVNSKEALELAKLAEKNNLTLMVGHVFEYNQAVVEMKKIINKGILGNIYYLHFTRTGLGPIRQDVSAMWDLAPHDISILLYLLEEEPSKVLAKGKWFIQKGIDDVVFITYEFKSGIIANIHISWLDPRKKREVTVVGSKKMMVFDDMDLTDKLFIYDKGVTKELVEGTLDEFQLAVRVGDVYIPKINYKEPLKEECLHFIDCLLKNKKPKSDGWSGYQVVKVLESAEKSLKEGKEIEIAS